MAPRPRTRLTAEQRAELWRRWKAGESINEIGAALQRWPHFVYDVRWQTADAYSSAAWCKNSSITTRHPDRTASMSLFCAVK